VNDNVPREGKDPYPDESCGVGFAGVTYPVPCRAATRSLVPLNGRGSCIIEATKWKAREGNDFEFTTYHTRRPRMAHCPRPRTGNERGDRGMLGCRRCEVRTSNMAQSVTV
jgi:hypothetical protein